MPEGPEGGVISKVGSLRGAVIDTDVVAAGSVVDVAGGKVVVDTTGAVGGAVLVGSEDDGW